jgi:hypothetical protein
MFTLPWQKAKDVDDPLGRFVQLLLWSFGWLWSIVGLILGAFIATPILTRVGLVNTPSQDWLTYGIVALCAFAVQLLSFGVFMLLLTALEILENILENSSPFVISDAVGRVITTLLALVILGGESYALYRFIQTQNVQQGLVTGYAVGGFIVKAIIFPVLKSLAVALIVKPILKWLRGEDSKA